MSALQEVLQAGGVVGDGLGLDDAVAVAVGVGVVVAVVNRLKDIKHPFPAEHLFLFMFHLQSAA